MTSQSQESQKNDKKAQKKGNWKTATVGRVFVVTPYESGMIDEQCHFTNLREPGSLKIFWKFSKTARKVLFPWGPVQHFQKMLPQKQKDRKLD